MPGEAETMRIPGARWPDNPAQRVPGSVKNCLKKYIGGQLRQLLCQPLATRFSVPHTLRQLQGRENRLADFLGDGGGGWSLDRGSSREGAWGRLPTEHSRLSGYLDTRDWGEAPIQTVGICVRASLRWDPSLFFK